MSDQMDRLVAEAGEKMPREWLGTGDLPDDVVAQELAAWVYVTTDADNPRHGEMWAAFLLGGRPNPELTPDEAEYIAKVFEAEARYLRARASTGGAGDVR